MQTNEQRRLYEELELMNRQEPEIKTSRLKELFKTLRTKWQSAITFLTEDDEPQRTQKYKPDYPTDFAWWYVYGWQAGHYALMNLELSSKEDVQNWLERSYQDQSNDPRIIW